ncbi:DUF4105 domain-containing protein [Bartonella tamiae]|uniref:Lnb N-terminal periplasmic domain-containing protein n=1 Tax=Bartonella tamiae Th239 TaxID=1094558 RepID=J0QWG9_9HYPH|nr:DUF4105 domain-containing protein [Bartonella tamiae]EJF90381.1 hypothetical protein ME5_00782 [Bartonella tamiae Th239]EJF93675.1 hypothetical protein MEG_01099 [Bartonella tamiae Th307]
MKKFKSFLRVLWVIIALFALVCCLFGFWFQLTSNTVFFIIIALLWSLLGLFGLIYEWKKTWLARFVLISMFVCFGLWWSTITPSLHRDWAPELQHTVQAEINYEDPQRAIIKNIRDFDWISRDKAKENWINKSYNINDIIGMDIYLSYWMGPYIAHTLVGFTFLDGQNLVFSAEIRREKKERFSAVGGFFKQFELAMIAATEEDIIKLRTDIRGENVYRYSLLVPPKKMQELFINYLKMGNELSQQAEFYNTLTTNCTTVVFDMARILDPGIPLDWRILFSGQLPSYLYNHQLIETNEPLKEIVNNAYITPKNTLPRDQYSRAIRDLPLSVNPH